ncbi:ABC transporter ATP-binding protein [Marinobacter xestospongiae]|uniref:ABC transporter ATP-binding protein n=1 Tax=Marinobacter xestospongiae TaxID=994319 RepID=A0ABU3W0S0_9GAMM|nr:ABC transporter ATP-binding protein [Marinobacter xestospongiae]MDV2079940.1 ABC transporter ATP-binding protein [Marinobacter xestospongiae]
MSVLISVENLGKAFRSYPNARQRIKSWLGLPTHNVQDVWVLRHLNFEVYSGEAVGLIGENGAGKSTLLKMIAGTLAPTEGQIQLFGEVRAILELGMGFNGEFTGRENARHGLSMMGLSAEEAEALVPEVEAFAEVGEYFDRPLRTYSSGMQMRVTFAVATARRPQVLIVDEALAVGDAYFQHKSFEKIREMQQAGTTLLIVSHDRGAIQRICDRVILLENGQISREGEPEAIMDYYNAMLANKGNERHSVESEMREDGRVATTSGTGEAEITSVELRDADEGTPVEVATVGQTLELVVTVAIHEPVEELVIGYVIKDRLRQDVFGTNTHYLKAVRSDLKPGQTLNYRFRFPCHLGEGSYSFSVAAHADDTHVRQNYHWRDLACTFEVVNAQQDRFLGVAWLPPVLSIEQNHGDSQ